MALWLDKASSDYTNIQSLGLWVAALMTGGVAVLYAKAFRVAESLALEILLTDSRILMLSTPFFFLLAWWVVQRFSPEASGSGIPQVMVVIEKGAEPAAYGFTQRLLSIKTVLIKILSSLLCVLGGGAIGREGPTLQISAAIFYNFGKYIRKFYPQSDQKTWVIAGAAAGLASAFNTPLGGIVYAIEELGMSHHHRIRTALLTSVIISGLVAQSLIGSYLYLGFPQLTGVVLAQWPLVILVGIVAGLMGAFFSQFMLWLSRRRKQIQNLRKLGLITLFVGMLTALLLILEPRSLGSGGELISDILFKGEAANFGIILSRMLATGLAYLSGAAGGIFSPSLAIGASIGSKIAYVFHAENANLFAMLGMIGFLTGVTHTPFTSFILVMEMSDRHSAIFPMMVAALVANSIAKSISDKSFYEHVRDDFIQKASLDVPK